MEYNFDNIINDAVQKAAETNSTEIGDYVENNLVHCGKCHTPKQTVISLFGVLQTVWCDCKCRHEAYQTERKKLKSHMSEAEREKQRDICFQYAGSLINSRFSHDDGKGDKNVMKKLFTYADNFEEPYQRGLGLLLYGNYGTGKSFGAACIANHVIDYGYSAIFTSISQILNEVWDKDRKQDYLNNLNDCDLLIIDDFGTERSTDYASEIVTSVLNGRYNSGKPLIITTNLTPEQLKPSDNPKTERIMSRIMGRCMPIKCTGQDRRRNALNQNAEFFKSFFNGD